jgi:hypothetical protein
MPGKSGTGEAEVVRAEDLARVLRSAQYRYDATHPEQGRTWKHSHKGRHPQLSFQAYLAYRCRIMDPNGIGINERRIYMLLRGTEQKYVGLWTADLVLTAAGLNELLYTDEVPILPNPRWSKVRYDAYMDAMCAETTMEAPRPTGRID